MIDIAEHPGVQEMYRMRIELCYWTQAEARLRQGMHALCRNKATEDWQRDIVEDVFVNENFLHT